MLKHARDLIDNNGVILVALALPLQQFVVGSTRSSAVQEKLLEDDVNSSGHRSVDEHFYETADKLIHELFIPLQYRVAAVCRVDYNMIGHTANEVWKLDNAIFSLRREEL